MLTFESCDQKSVVLFFFFIKLANQKNSKLFFDNSKDNNDLIEL